MNQHNESNGGGAVSGLGRRDFMKGVAGVAAVGALAGVKVPSVFAAEDNTIRMALIGCGGRGGGAAVNALSTPDRNVKLVAMADVFEDPMKKRHDGLTKGEQKDLVDVPQDRMFLGFDAYKQAMDCLRPGDVAILTTPPAFRWPHFKYAIDRGLNVFMEKPVTVDAPTTKRMIALGEEAKGKNLKVGVGLMCRHCDARKELYQRIKDGAIGDITLMRAYRTHSPVAECFVPRKPADMSENLYQVQKFHAFLWASGGLFSDFYIHNIDECCWMKDAWPVKAEALGGRHYRGDMVDQNFDTYDVEYTFADGSKFFFQGRCMDGCDSKFASYAHGTKGSAQISAGGHTPAGCKIWDGQDMEARSKWKYGKKERNPYQLEWDYLLEAIRKDVPFNEVRRGAEVSLVSSMGRLAAHTGQVVTWEQMVENTHEFAPDVDKMTNDGPSPVKADKDGRYPVPAPGVKRDREY